MEYSESNDNRMGTAPITKLIISMSLPAMFSMFIQALYNIVDSIYVTRICEEALTAVSLVMPIQNLMISVCVGGSVGVGSLVARRLGEKRRGDADNAASHGVVLAVLSYVLFAILGLTAMEPFLATFTDDPLTLRYGVDYATVVTVFSLGVFVQVAYEKILQAAGDMIWPMISHVIGAVTNIILDPIMIFGLLGFPRLEVKGAAIATVISQFVAMTVLIIVQLTRKDHRISIKLRGFRFNWPITRDIYEVGLPSMVMQSIGSVMNAGMNYILHSFTPLAVNVLGIYFKINSFVFLPLFGLNQGLMPILGFNFGARNKKRFMHALKVGLIIALGIMVIGMIIFWIFTPQVFALFKAGKETMDIGVPALRIIALTFPPAAVCIILGVAFQATGRGMYSMYVSLLRQLVALLPLAWLLAHFGGLDYVWYSFPLAEFVSIIISILLFRKLYKKKIETLEPEEA